MEPLTISHQPGKGLHIEGFPDAVKVIKLSDRKARRLSDLALHHLDLRVCEQSLQELREIQNLTELTRQNIWMAVITRFFKCFSANKGRRFLLDHKKILRNDAEGQAIFVYFDNLRNKHLVHDDNSYSQCNTGAILNNVDAEYKIAKITSSTVVAGLNIDGDMNNLRLLCLRAKEWVVQEYDKLADEITRDLEARNYEDLINEPNLSFKAPTLEEIGETRELG